MRKQIATRHRSLVVTLGQGHGKWSGKQSTIRHRLSCRSVHFVLNGFEGHLLAKLLAAGGRCSHLLEAVQVRMDEQATLTVGTNAIFGVFVTVPCLVLVVDGKRHPEIGQIFMIHRKKEPTSMFLNRPDRAQNGTWTQSGSPPVPTNSDTSPSCSSAPPCQQVDCELATHAALYWTNTFSSQIRC